MSIHNDEKSNVYIELPSYGATDHEEAPAVHDEATAASSTSSKTKKVLKAALVGLLALGGAAGVAYLGIKDSCPTTECGQQDSYGCYCLTGPQYEAYKNGTLTCYSCQSEPPPRPE